MAFELAGHTQPHYGQIKSESVSYPTDRLLPTSQTVATLAVTRPLTGSDPLAVNKKNSKQVDELDPYWPIQASFGPIFYLASRPWILWIRVKVSSLPNFDTLNALAKSVLPIVSRQLDL